MCAIVDILLVLIVILVIVLAWRGPKMLPQFGEALGKTIKGVRDNVNSDVDDASAPASKDDDSDSTTGS